MPETIATTIPAEKVRKGDRVTVPTRKGDTTYTVTEITIGRKWATARHATGVAFEVLLETPVTVLREQDTQEEKDQMEAARLNRRVSSWLQEKSEASSVLQLEDSSYRVANHLQAASEKRLALWFYENFNAYIGREGNYSTPVGEFAVKFIAHETRKYTQNVRVLSRSTSVVDNLIEDINRAVFFEFVELVDRGF